MLRLALAATALLFASPSLLCGQTASPALTWSELPPLPDTVGLAGAFVGVSNGALLVAGGANFPDGRPWGGAKKVWHDEIYVLTDPRGKWSVAGTRLPRPLGYGISADTAQGVLCIGGSDVDRHYADCFLLTWTGNDVRISPVASLPKPLANGCGTRAGHAVYVAGGTDTPAATVCSPACYSLDLTPESPAAWQWTRRPTWPGLERMLAVAGSVGTDFYLIGGLRLKPGPEGPSERIKPFLRDAYRYSPGDNGQDGVWRRLADLPAPRAAGPSPALEIRPHQLALFGGDDGSRGVELRDQHPGFPPDIFVYHADADEWTRTGSLPAKIVGNPVTDPAASVWAPVTTGVARWNGRIVIPTGEARPGVRTPRVLATP
uniref:Galactose oxidase n=1 Tax=Schlesneria paludicola TaxID=360056 RepID=A0A7C2NWY5_9PLAN